MKKIIFLFLIMPLAYGLILVIASFMVFNDLENAGNMASLLQMLAASMDTAHSIDDTPVTVSYTHLDVYKRQVHTSPCISW